MASRKRKLALEGKEDEITPYMSPFKKTPKAPVKVSSQWSEWTPQEVADHVRMEKFDDSIAKKFEDERITGDQLPLLTEGHLREWGIVTGDSLKLLRLFEKMARPDIYLAKVFNDPIHGHIELEPILIKIIDTPQFQRLRDIKQLGGTYFVFPGGSHNRFEHCIGVAHLAGCLVQAIRERQPNLGITDTDVLCCKMAGLCHDLGHGPFSHMFDRLFIPMVSPGSEWKHETASVNMLDYLIEDNNLLEDLQESGVGKQDLKFVKELIAGPCFKDDAANDDWPYVGREMNKGFLYEVVSNQRNGIDVDKWDYFARDCHNLGISVMFDYRRFLKFARVIRVENKYQICTRDKEVGNLYDMFHTRNSLHRRAYQHKTSNIIEQMICEALVKANDYFILLGRNGAKVRMSDAIHDMHAYLKLTDSVFWQILASSDPNLEESRTLLRAIQQRKLYRCVAQTNVMKNNPYETSDAKRLAKEIVAAQVKLESHLKEEKLPSNLSSDEVCVHVVNFNYGMKQQNPVDNVRFYQKDQPNKASRVKKDQVSRMLPEHFAEQSIRLYLRDHEDLNKLRTVNWCFRQWCKDNKYPLPKPGDMDLELISLKCDQDQSESLPSSQTLTDKPGDMDPELTPLECDQDQSESLSSSQTLTCSDFQPPSSDQTPTLASVGCKPLCPQSSLGSQRKEE